MRRNLGRQDGSHSRLGTRHRPVHNSWRRKATIFFRRSRPVAGIVGRRAAYGKAGMELRSEARKRVHRSYAHYGAIFGAALVLLVVLVVSKPYFQEWPVVESIIVVVGSGLVGAVLGYFAILLIL